MRTKAVYLYNVSFLPDLTRQGNLRKNHQQELMIYILNYSDCRFDDVRGEISLLKQISHVVRNDSYFISEPGLTSESGATIDKEPSAFSAHRIIPCDSIPRNFLGARLTKIETCFPIKSSGL